MLVGEVKSTRYYATLVTYGLSIFGGFPWLIGLPSGWITNELAVEFYLEDGGTRTVLWRKRYKEVYKTTYRALYGIWPRQFNYDVLFKTILRDVVKDLRSTFPQSEATGG